MKSTGNDHDTWAPHLMTVWLRSVFLLSLLPVWTFGSTEATAMKIWDRKRDAGTTGGKQKD